MSRPLHAGTGWPEPPGCLGAGLAPKARMNHPRPVPSRPRRVLAFTLAALAGLWISGLGGNPAWAQARLPLGAAATPPAPNAAAGASVPAGPMGRVIVHWRTDASWAERDFSLQQRGERLAVRTGLPVLRGRAITERTQVLRVPGLSSQQLADRLSRDPGVALVEVDERLRRLQAAPAVNDPRFASVPLPAGPVVGQWYLQAPSPGVVSSINAVAGWQRSTGSPSVVVAVLDTGIRYDHPDLQGGNFLPGRDFIGDDDGNSRDITGSILTPGSIFLTAGDGGGRDDDPSDPGDFLSDSDIANSGGVFTRADCAVGDYTRSSWHGTQVAGLIGAATNNGRGIAGVARNVRVMPVRVLGKCGGYTSDIAAAMRWAAGLQVPNEPINLTPARVLNLSLGGGAGPCSGSPTLQSAVAAVSQAGAVVVVAAGNSEGLAVSRPANCPGAIAVAAVRHTGTKVGFSDLGPEVAISAPGGNCVNLAGDCLYPMVSTTNAGRTQPIAGSDAYTDGRNAAVGTSFAAPLVSGAAALILSIRPDLSPEQVLTALRLGARDFPVGQVATTCRAPDSNPQSECNCTKTTCGAGLLDVDRSLVEAAALRAGSIFSPGPPAPAPAPEPAPASSGGGGAVGVGWLLALALAVVTLVALNRRSAG